LEDSVARSVTVITALAPVIGYAQAAGLAKQALATDEKISDLVVQRGLLEREQLDALLRPERLTGMGTDHNVTTDPDSAEAVPRDEMTTELPVVPESEE
ncbi:MAG: aspartate ammonia-lyase, partial [Brevibacterium sp.]|nr:aspartate ammonia-lyase [Brevibacterium sp.]